MTTKLIQELVGLAIDRADKLNGYAEIGYGCQTALSIKIYSSSIDAVICRGAYKPAQLQAAIDKIKEL